MVNPRDKSEREIKQNSFRTNEDKDCMKNKSKLIKNIQEKQKYSNVNLQVDKRIVEYKHKLESKLH
jgi:hypothetical protein